MRGDASQYFIYTNTTYHAQGYDANPSLQFPSFHAEGRPYGMTVELHAFVDVVNILVPTEEEIIRATKSGSKFLTFLATGASDREH